MRRISSWRRRYCAGRKSRKPLAWGALPSTLGSAIGSAGPGIAVERIVGAAVGAGAGVLLARETRRPPRQRPEDAALVALARQARIGVDGGDQRLAGLALGQEPRATARRRLEHHVAWPVLPRQPRGARAVGPAAGIAGACELRPVAHHLLRERFPAGPVVLREEAVAVAAEVPVSEGEGHLEGVRGPEHLREVGSEDRRLLVPVEAIDEHGLALRRVERLRGLVRARRLPPARRVLGGDLVPGRVTQPRYDAEPPPYLRGIAEHEELVLVAVGADHDREIGRAHV